VTDSLNEKSVGIGFH